MFFISIEKVIQASPEQVFDVLSQHDEYDKFRSVTESKLITKGDLEDNGLGAIRSIASNSFKVIEEIVAFERPYHFGYKITQSSPFNIEHELGDIRLEETIDGHTLIKWISKGKVTTPLIGWLLDKQMTKNGHKVLGSILRDIENQLI